MLRVVASSMPSGGPRGGTATPPVRCVSHAPDAARSAKRSRKAPMFRRRTRFPTGAAHSRLVSRRWGALRAPRPPSGTPAVLPCRCRRPGTARTPDLAPVRSSRTGSVLRHQKRPRMNREVLALTPTGHRRSHHPDLFAESQTSRATPPEPASPLCDLHRVNAERRRQRPPSLTSRFWGPLQCSGAELASQPVRSSRTGSVLRKTTAHES